MTQTFETKSATDDVASAFDDFARAFEAFKEANDERLGQIETRLSTDALTEEKLARIDGALDDAKRRIDRLSLDRARPPLGTDAPRDPLLHEHKAAFRAYMRSGEASGLKRLEEKALSAGSGPTAAISCPTPWSARCCGGLANVSPIRAVASVRVISGGQYKRAFSTAGAASGWVGETAARPQSASPTLAEMSFPAMELYAMPAATQTLLDDAVVDVDQWIAEEVETAFAEQESAAFVSGDGVNKPRGFLASPTVANASWSWGSLGYLATGGAAFPATNPSDILVELVYALRAGYLFDPGL
jgi:HK97 family phage major capsid protein